MLFFPPPPGSDVISFLFFGHQEQALMMNHFLAVEGTASAWAARAVMKSPRTPTHRMILNSGLRVSKSQKRKLQIQLVRVR